MGFEKIYQKEWRLELDGFLQLKPDYNPLVYTVDKLTKRLQNIPV